MAFANPIGSTIAVGRQCRLNINDKTLCFARAVPKSTRELVTNQDNSICGDIDININRVQKGRQIVGWSLFLDPTWPIFEVVAPLLGNTDEGSDVWSLGATDALETFSVHLDMVGAVHHITNAFTTKWALRGSKGGRPVQMQIDIMGETETAGSFTEDKVDFGAEFAFTHSSITLEDDTSPTPVDRARSHDRFLLQVDNNVVYEHANSITMTDALIGNRQAMLATSVPYVSDEDDLYFHYRDDSDGKNSVLVLDNGEKILTFTMPAGLPIAKPASILGKMDQVRTPVTMMLCRDFNVSRISPLTIAATDPP